MSRIKKAVRVILSYPSRLFNGISLRATVVDSKVDKKAVVEHGANVRYSYIGKYTYISARSSLVHSEIGSFCSVASGVSIGGGAHDLTSVSTSPVFFSGRNIFKKNFAGINFDPYKKTVIGNDVWIGNRAIVLQGVHIGDGAVIGAGSVVTKDIAPYSVAAGNPAREIKKRFDDETIDKLLKSEWWNLDDSELAVYGKAFSSPEKLIKEIGENSK